MTRSISLLSALALTLGPVACLSNSDNGAPATHDAGSFAPEDSGAQGGDATVSPPADAGFEASSPTDGAPQPLTVHVTSAGAPESGIPIVFQDATGAVLSSATTDATGAISQMIPAGIQVTAIFGTVDAPALVTVQGVQPGDVIAFADAVPFVDRHLGTVAITAPPPIWDASEVAESASMGPCQSTLPGTLNLESFCQTAGTFPIFISAQDTSGQEVAYTYQNGNTIPDAGADSSAALALDVTVARAWSLPTATQTVTATNVPLSDDAGDSNGNVELDDTEIVAGLLNQIGASSQGGPDQRYPKQRFPGAPRIPRRRADGGHGYVRSSKQRERIGHRR